jgi:hypothetical protein
MKLLEKYFQNYHNLQNLGINLIFYKFYKIFIETIQFIYRNEKILNVKQLEKFITSFRNQSNEVINNNLKYNFEYTIDNSNFNTKDNYRLDYFLSKRI